MSLESIFTKAFNLAQEAHKNQTRWGGESYFDSHILPVALEAYKNYGITAATVGLLHDVVEDTNVTFEDLELDYPWYIVNAVRYITKKQGENYDTYIQRVKNNHLATFVKIIDIKNNMESLPKNQHHQRFDKYSLALLYLEQDNNQEDEN